MGDLLGIKPLVTISLDGAVVMAGRAHGRKRALKELAERFMREEVDPAYPVYFLCTDTKEPARALMQAVNYENAAVFQICCAVGTHIGPNAAGYVYVAKSAKTAKRY